MIRERPERGAICGEGLHLAEAGEFCFRLSRLALLITVVVLPSTVCWQVIPRPVGTVELYYSDLLLYLSDIPLVAAVSAWVLGHLLCPGRHVRVGHWYIAGPVLVLLSLTLLSIIWAENRAIAAETAVRTIILFGFYLIAANESQTQGFLAMGLVVGLLIQAPLALMQFLTQGPVGLAFLGEIPWHEDTPGAWLRGYGLSLHPNILGGFLALGLLSLIGPALARRTFTLAVLPTSIKDILKVIVPGFLFALGVAGLLGTFSRSAWLGFAAGFLYLAVLLLRLKGARRIRPVLLPCVILLAVVASVFVRSYPQFVATRLLLPTASILRGEASPDAHLELADLESRNRLHGVAIDLITANPLLGVGAGNFAVAYYERKSAEAPSDGYQPEHNIPLLVTAELGPLGGIAWLLLVIAPLIVTLKRPKRGASPWSCLWAASLLTVLVISGFDFYFWERQQGRALFWVLLGAWVVSCSIDAEE